ncbi:uncharacterized protein [Palaemon carinicauda]|uniref:uncharacterized protein n=1 Tax=Palaemon carinicauda TaxID=392227 RepID=UPI0035B645F8
MSYTGSGRGIEGFAPADVPSGHPRASASENLVDYVTDGTTRCSAHYKEKLTKICKVCGDIAKSYHFGGLSCDSCKAFFRRTVQSESWETFLCITGGNCVITPHKRSCQACRYELCRKIGMDPSLVMTMKDRKALMYRKLERKKQQLLENYQMMEFQYGNIEPTQRQNTGSTLNNVYHEASMELDNWDSNDTIEILSAEVKTDKDSCPEEDADDCLIIETLSPKNHEKIEGLQKILKIALKFPEFPKHYYEEGADVTEHLFFVFCKSMGKFFSLVPEFRDLDDKDRGILLKDAVTKSIFIFGAHQFQEDDECWPRKLLSPFCTFPTVSLATTEKFIDDEDTFLRMKTFMRKYCRFFDDEVVTLLCLMIGAFDTDVLSLTDLSKIERHKAIYIQLLEDYLHYQNASISVTLFSSELWNCFTEVKGLKESFQKSDSQDKKDKSEEKDEASFASSLSALSEDPKMPPKKAFYERNKAKENSHTAEIVQRNELKEMKLKTISLDETPPENKDQIIEEDDIMITKENLHKTYFNVTQDHNYQKPRAQFSRRESHCNSRFQVPEEEVQILPPVRMGGQRLCGKKSLLQSNIQSQQITGTIRPNIIDEVPDRRFQTVFSRQTSPANSASLVAPQSNPCSSRQNNISSSTHIMPVEYPSHLCSQSGLSTVHDRQLYIPVNSQNLMYSSTKERRPLDHDLQHESEVISMGNISSPPEILPPHPLNDMTFQIPMRGLGGTFKEAEHPHPYPEHPNRASGMYLNQHQGFPPDYCEPSGPCFNRIFPHSQPQMSRQSPMSEICNNLTQLSTQDDHQLVEAAQNVLPSHLVKHLINRLSNGQREQL